MRPAPTPSPRRPGATPPAALAAGLVAAAAVFATAAITGLAGCATYANYPAVGERDLAVNNVNVAPLPTIMTRAAGRVIALDAIAGELPELWVLNLPQGATVETARDVLANVQRIAEVRGGLLVGEPGWQQAPAYSITGVRLRGDRASVDVARPVSVVTGPGQAPAYQKVTLRLTGGLAGWRVTSVREWPIGAEPEPQLFGWPEQDLTAPAEGDAEQTDAGGAAAQPIAAPADSSPTQAPAGG
jgi:hypothetical protein